MWSRVIICLSFLLVINTDAHSDHKKDGDIPEYEMHNLHDSEIVYDASHAKEHLSESLSEEQMANMTDEELAFHFFNEHDYNKDYLLDGLEILSSLSHVFVEEHILGPLPSEEILKQMTDEERKKLDQSRSEQLLEYITDLIDEVFVASDLNHDGYLNYVEFNHAREIQKGKTQDRPDDHKHVKG